MGIFGRVSRIAQGKARKKMAIFFRRDGFWRCVVLQLILKFVSKVICAWSLFFQAFSSRWEQFYFLESFNLAPKQIKSGDTTNQARNAAIKMQTCRQFVDFSHPIAKSLFVLSKTRYFVSKLRTKEKKDFVPFLLSSRQTGFRVHSARTSGTFFLSCKSLPSITCLFRVYSIS